MTPTEKLGRFLLDYLPAMAAELNELIVSHTKFCVAAAIAEKQEECCKAICHFCHAGWAVRKCGEAWHHESANGSIAPCQAAAIRVQTP